VSDNDGSWMDHRDELFERVVQRGRARRRRRAFMITASVFALLIALAVGLYLPAHRTSLVRVAGPGSTSTTVPPQRPASVLLVGDSVMLGAQDAIERTIPGAHIDAAVSRQFDQGATILDSDKQGGGLPRTIVVHLGDNGPVSAAAFDQMMRAAGPKSTLLFLTVKVPRSWAPEVNDALRNGVRRWPNAHVLDWQHYSSSHSDWFLLDGFHLTAVGQTAFAAFIHDGVSAADQHTPVAPRGSSASYPEYVLHAMTHTLEVDQPDEHFTPVDSTISTSDGRGGTIVAVVGIHTPHADSAGQLVFFFHNSTFVGWDAPQEAMSILRLVSPGPQAIAVTYANYGPHDAVIGASLPPATVIYRWDGRRIAPDTQPPPGVYQLNDPHVHALHVKFVP
jgi:LppP/LprE lipoprotein